MVIGSISLGLTTLSRPPKSGELERFWIGVAKPILHSFARATDYTRRDIAVGCNTAAWVNWIVVETTQKP